MKIVLISEFKNSYKQSGAINFMVWYYIVLFQLVADGKVVKKDRCLLFFNNIVLCAAMRRRKKKGFYKINKEELESSTGSRWVGERGLCD